jgi:hypothetical protein
LRHYLIPREGRPYRANLHCHSTCSDGARTPEELKQLYKSQGYSVLAYTDHEFLIDHSELDDDGFLALTGYEFAFCENWGAAEYPRSRTFEFNLFAMDQHNMTQVCFNPKYILHGDKSRIPSIRHVGNLFEREYTIPCINGFIQTARENGFLVSLNHPHYSMETADRYGCFDGLFAMEIYNHVSFIGLGVNDYGIQGYDTLLRRGRRLSCIAADDNHGKLPVGDARFDSFGGFTMIKADGLRYDRIVSALEKGDFYSSCGPLIEDLYVQDDKVHLRCSPAKSIVMATKWRYGAHRRASDGEHLTEAVFDLPGSDEYMRFDVIDDFGRHANTRAYHLDALR